MYIIIYFSWLGGHGKRRPHFLKLLKPTTIKEVTALGPLSADKGRDDVFTFVIMVFVMVKYSRINCSTLW